MMNANILDTINPRELGKQLQESRRRAGLTQDDAAKVIDVSRTTIIAIEKGERRVKAGELIKLAQAFGRSAADFVRSRPQVEAFQPQFRGPYLRTLEDDAEIAPKIDEFEDLCRDYLELEQITNSPLIRKYPPEYSISHLPIDEVAEEVANEERYRLRLGDGPIQNLRDVLEQEVGLRIFYLALPSTFSAMYAYTEETGACIAVNSQHPLERRRMSLTHDYSHFLASRFKPVILIEDRYQRLPASERFAGAFAPAFLMPAEGLTRRFNDVKKAQGNVTLADLLRMAHYYGVSFEAFTNRLEDLKLLPVGKGKSLKDGGLQVRKAQQQLGLDPVPALEDTLPLRYQYLACEACKQGLISEGRLAKFLKVDRLEARRITEALQERQDVSIADVTLSPAMPHK